jgi:hypothetical protein
MRTARYLLRRLPWIGLGVILGGVCVWVIMKYVGGNPSAGPIVTPVTPDEATRVALSFLRINPPVADPTKGVSVHRVIPVTVTMQDIWKLRTETRWFIRYMDLRGTNPLTGHCVTVQIGFAEHSVYVTERGRVFLEVVLSDE